MIALVALLTIAAAILQAGAIPALYPSGAAPLLPVAIIAAWSAIRQPRELWLALLLGAVVLGVNSGTRSGAYLLALLMPSIMAVALQPLLDEQRHTVTLLQRLGGSAAIGGGGALLYVSTLALGSGSLHLVRAALEAPLALLTAALWTACIAGALTGLLWPLRARPESMFT